MTHFLQRSALIALATGALGACTSDEALRPNFPTRLPEPGPAPAAPAAAPAPAPVPPPPPSDAPATAAPAAPVEQHPLEPLAPAGSSAPPAARPATAAPAPPPPAPVPDATPAPVPAYRSVTTRTVTGRVVEVEGRAVTYRVRKGDTLEEIADRLGTTVSQLREDNRLRKRAKIYPGQTLKGPRRQGRAYVAESGDTLYSIARRFGVTEAALRRENALRRAGLHPGERIRLPEGFRDHGPLTVTSRTPVSPGAAAAEPPAEGQASEDRAAAPPPGAAGPTSAYRTVTIRSVTGRVVEVEGPAARYRVRRGDNLSKIARKLDTTVQQLREDNDLGRHEAIHPGEVLKGPRVAARAYVAESGDTLYSIARRFGVTPEALREENGLSRRSDLHPGERLRLPRGYRDHGPLTSTSRVLVATPTPPRSYAPPPPAPAPPTPVTAGPTPAPSLGETQISELGRGRFVWPLQGPIVSDFGPKAPGQRNDGINIGSQVGASVRAAAAGDVVYAGDQVPGFGNLVLIKHADGWVTAYGHLSRVLVKMQQKVTQGEEIGLAGATGGVSEPQLHFEIRYASSPLERAKPIDPKLVLPQTSLPAQTSLP